MPRGLNSTEHWSVPLFALSKLGAIAKHLRIVPVQRNEENWKDHLLVLLVLLLASLALFLAIPHGNQLGRDEWPVAYTVSHGESSYGEGRSIYPWLLWYPITGLSFAGNYYLYLLLRSGCSFLVYLIVQLYAHDRLFAAASGVISSIYIIRDEFFLEPYPLLNALTIILFALAGLYLYLCYMRDRRPGALAVAIIFVIASLVVYEITIPLLIGVAVFLFALEHNFSPYRLIGFGIWLAVLIAFLVAFIAPSLGIGSTTYSSGMTVQLSLENIVRVARVHLAFGFAKPFVVLIRLSEVANMSAVVLTTVVIVLFGIYVLRSRLNGVYAEKYRGYPLLLHYGAWIVIGLIVTFLSFAPFLITIYAVSPWRTHILAVYGEAVTLVAGIWFTSLLIGDPKARWLIRYLGLAMIVMWGSRSEEH